MKYYTGMIITCIGGGIIGYFGRGGGIIGMMILLIGFDIKLNE